MSYRIIKIVWEYHEAYGDVYYPQSIDDMQHKLQELERHVYEGTYPFYVELFLDDDTYIGIILSHELSCFVFGRPQPESAHDQRLMFDVHYNEDTEDADHLIEYSFMGSQSWIPKSQLLPKDQVMQTISQYIHRGTVPSFICFTRPEYNDRYCRE